MISLNIHDVESVEIFETVLYALECESDNFCSREIVITLEDGTKQYIILFAKDENKLNPKKRKNV